MSHTPGPWATMLGTGVYSEGGREIVYWAHNTRSGDKAEQEANAHLIAAAPDLLKALKECRNAIQGGKPFDPYDSRGAGFQQQFGVAFLEYLNSAIAKATEAA